MKNTKSSGFASSIGKEHRLGEEARRRLWYLVGGVAFGFLLPCATVYGDLAPFGIGLVASVTGSGSVLIGMATLAGYLVQRTADSLRYLAAILTVAGLRWAVGGFQRVTRSRLVSPVIAFLATVITGSALWLGKEPSFLGVLTILSESLLAGGFAFFTSTVCRELTATDHGVLSEEARVCLLLLFSVAMMALFTLEWGGIAPARIVAMVFLLLASRTAGPLGGGIAGIAMGTALLISTPYYAFLTPAYALGGLLSGLLSGRSRVMSALMLLVATGIVAVPSGNEESVVVALYEAAAAGVIFLVLPPSADIVTDWMFHTARRLPEVRSARQAVALKIDHAACAVAEVAGTVDEVSTQLSGLGAPDPGSAYRAATDEVCRTCPSRISCWQRYFSDTMDSLNRLTPLFREQDTLSVEQLVGRLATHCVRKTELVARLNVGYREYRVRESAFRRLNELRAVITDQFSATAQLLSEFSEALAQPEWSDVETASRIRDELENQNVRVRQVVCRLDERSRMEVEMVLDGRYKMKRRDEFSQRMGNLCGRCFALPVIEYADRVTRISFTERHRLRVAVGEAQLRCDGEQLCGDAYECFQDGTGRSLAVLSDGMGSGGRAAVDSAMTARLAARLLKAGFGNESLLRLINTALMAKSEDESLSTLDIAAINLFTGDLELLKAGAGLSLLYSKGRVCRLNESSLPLGILRELSFACTRDRLTEGDVLVMMSDGVSDNGVEWIEELLRDYDREAGGMQGLAQLIADTARDRQPTEKSDDITVITLGVYHA